MSNAHDDTASGAEHPGFLQKLKDRLHIGHHKETATHDVAAKDVHAVEKPASAEPTSAEPAPFPAAPVKEEVPPTKPEGGEHHGGTHTFLADLPEKDLPTEETKQHLHHVTPEEAPTTPGGGVPEGGVPTFLADLPDKDLPTEETKSHLHHVTPEVHSLTPALDSEEGPKETAEFYDSKEVPSAGSYEFFDSEEVFSKAQEGEHHEGVPTFLVALPEADIQAEKEKLHHVEAPEREPNTTTDSMDSEEVFSNAQQGEHHGGVPTFMVALPDEEIPQEVNKGGTPEMAGKATDESSRAAPGEFDSEEVFSKAQQGEHHEGVPTFLVALPDEDISESKQKLHHVTPTADE